MFEQRLRRIYNPIEHPQWSFDAKNFFFCKIHKKTLVPESLLNTVTGLSPITSLKERTPIQVFSDEILRDTLDILITSMRLLLFYRKIFSE